MFVVAASQIPRVQLDEVAAVGGVTARRFDTAGCRSRWIDELTTAVVVTQTLVEVLGMVVYVRVVPLVVGSA